MKKIQLIFNAEEYLSDAGMELLSDVVEIIAQPILLVENGTAERDDIDFLEDVLRNALTYRGSVHAGFDLQEIMEVVRKAVQIVQDLRQEEKKEKETLH